MMFDKVSCRVCGVAALRGSNGTRKNGSTIYVDMQERPWRERTCPSCVKAYDAAYRLHKLNKPKLDTAICIICKMEYKKKAIRQICCSKQCYKAFLASHAAKPDIAS